MTEDSLRDFSRADISGMLRHQITLTDSVARPINFVRFKLFMALLLVDSNEEPARALDAGMVDILVDQFGASVGKPGYNDVIKAAIGEAVKTKVACRDEVRVSAALNTFFHIDTEVASAKAGDRGAVISAMPFNKGELGFRPLDLLNEFLTPLELFKNQPRLQKVKALWDTFKKNPEFVLVELGADCDHAQDTTRTHRYLVGLEVPVGFFELVRLRNISLFATTLFSFLARGSSGRRRHFCWYRAGVSGRCRIGNRTSKAS